MGLGDVLQFSSSFFFKEVVLLVLGVSERVRGAKTLLRAHSSSHQDAFSSEGKGGPIPLYAFSQFGDYK